MSSVFNLSRFSIQVDWHEPSVFSLDDNCHTVSQVTVDAKKPVWVCAVQHLARVIALYCVDCVQH